MGRKLSAREVALESSNGVKFQICHNCNGVEVAGDMEISNFEHMKDGDLSCVECEKKRLFNMKRRAQKNERKEIKRAKVQQIKTRIINMELEYGILCTGFFGWKGAITEIFDVQVEHLRKVGYQVLVYGDGATQIIVSEKFLPHKFEKTYREIFHEYEDICNDEIVTLVDRFNDFTEFSNKVIELITEAVV